MGPDYAMHIPQLQYRTILPMYIKSCLNLPAKRVRPPAEPVPKSPRRFRINSPS